MANDDSTFMFLMPPQAPDANVTEWERTKDLPDSAALASLQMLSVLWGDAEDKQLVTLELLYKYTVPHCALGDWDLGYRQTIMDEDGLAALIDMCSCVTDKVPVLPIYVLLQALNDPESERLHLTRMSHVLVKFGQRCAVLHLHHIRTVSGHLVPELVDFSQ
jgi:hypothetical protein